MTERLVFDGEETENNVLQSYYVAFGLHSIHTELKSVN